MVVRKLQVGTTLDIAIKQGKIIVYHKVIHLYSVTQREKRSTTCEHNEGVENIYYDDTCMRMFKNTPVLK